MTLEQGRNSCLFQDEQTQVANHFLPNAFIDINGHLQGDRCELRRGVPQFFEKSVSFSTLLSSMDSSLFLAPQDQIFLTLDQANWDFSPLTQTLFQSSTSPSFMIQNQYYPFAYQLYSGVNAYWQMNPICLSSY